MRQQSADGLRIAQMEDRQPLFDAVWNGHSEALTNEMTKLLRTTISYHDYGEDL